VHSAKVYSTKGFCKNHNDSIYLSLWNALIGFHFTHINAVHARLASIFILSETEADRAERVYRMPLSNRKCMESQLSEQWKTLAVSVHIVGSLVTYQIHDWIVKGYCKLIAWIVNYS